MGPIIPCPNMIMSLRNILYIPTRMYDFLSFSQRTCGKYLTWGYLYLIIYLYKPFSQKSTKPFSNNFLSYLWKTIQSRSKPLFLRETPNFHASQKTLNRLIFARIGIIHSKTYFWLYSTFFRHFRKQMPFRILVTGFSLRPMQQVS